MSIRCVVMPRIRLLLLALLAAFGCDACGPGVTVRAETAPPPSPQPACAAAPSPGKPALCIPEGGTEQFVVGLPEEHGWERGDWVTVNVAQPGITNAWPVALAVLVEPYRDVARASVLYQRNERGLDGSRVRRVGRGEHARLGKFVGSIKRIEGGRVELDLGAKDDARTGDIYEIRSAQDSSRPIARVRVTELGDLHLWAVPLDHSEPLREGQIAVYLRGHEASDGEDPQVSILVADFAPTNAQDAEAAKTAQGYSKELANTLDAAAAGMEGVSVRYEGNERVRVTGSDAKAYAEAYSLGKRHAADIVVWGSMRCGKRACAQPRVTVVNPERQRKGSDEGGRDAEGLILVGAAPTEPRVLAAAILGSVAFDARRYADASYYLTQAVSKKFLGPEDELRARWKLSHALSKRGQTAAARVQANALLKRARELHATRWEELGRRELARLDEQEGRVASTPNHILLSSQMPGAHDGASGAQPALAMKALSRKATTTPFGGSVPHPGATEAGMLDATAPGVLGATEAGVLGATAPGVPSATEAGVPSATEAGVSSATATRPGQGLAGSAPGGADKDRQPHPHDDRRTSDGNPCSPTCQQLDRGDGSGEMGDHLPAVSLSTVKMKPLNLHPAAGAKPAPVRPAAAPVRLWQRPAGLVAMGVGVAGVGVGAVLTGVAIGKYESSASHCDAVDRCDTEGAALRQNALWLGKGSTVVMIAGEVLLVGGAGLFLTAPSSATAPVRAGAKAGQWSARVEILPGGVQVRGAW
jgi:hypothetical protein